MPKVPASPHVRTPYAKMLPHHWQPLIRQKTRRLCAVSRRR